MADTKVLLRLLAFLAVFALVLGACGSDDGDSSHDGTDHDMEGMDQDTGGMSDEMAEMDHYMGDAAATRAADVDGAEVVAAEFVKLDTSPPGNDDVAGTAEIARYDEGTTVTVELTGLAPDVEYISHLHEAPCSDAGGDHYRFDKDGSEFPPNEIHLAFTSDSDGNGFMTAENDQTAGDDAVAIVVHPTDLLENKIACADF